MYKSMFEAAGCEHIRVFRPVPGLSKHETQRFTVKRLRYTDCGRFDCTVPPSFKAYQQAAQCLVSSILLVAPNLFATVSITGPVG